MIRQNVYSIINIVREENKMLKKGMKITEMIQEREDMAFVGAKKVNEKIHKFYRSENLGEGVPISVETEDNVIIDMDTM